MLTIEKKDQILRGFNFIDLFAGIGGFRVALDSLGGKCVFSSDIDPHARTVYHNNYGETPHGDITKIAAKEIPAHDILCAGFPCQPFSIAGAMGGFADTRGTLFHEVIRVAKHHRPRMVFLENVRNLTAHDSGNTLKTIIKALESIGYNVEWRVLNAGDYGVPQKRERIYILGFDKEYEFAYHWPAPLKTKTRVRDILDPAGDATVRQMHIDTAKYPPTVYAARKVPPGTHRPVRVGQVGLGRQGERIYHVDGHAVTLAASGGGVGAKTGMYFANKVVRRLTPREAARLNGFPESFQPHPKTHEALKQMGNAVVVDVVQHIMLPTKELFK